ncbi:hypothetical protein MM525_004855, partial [Escherichia coli]|nr:hypothetical protein [Escherichia coli]
QKAASSLTLQQCPVIDLIVVDDRDRQPIGRPYLTLAIDVFTRCVLGMVVTLEAPSAPIYCSQR